MSICENENIGKMDESRYEENIGKKDENNDKAHIAEDIPKDFKDTPGSVGTPSNILPTSEEKNKCNTEDGENKRNEGKRKSRRPSENDREYFPKRKKGRKTSPVKKKGLKTKVTKDKIINNIKAKG